MCSIFSIFELTQPAEGLRSMALKQSRKQRHRGPDWSGILIWPEMVMVHERLSIIDIDNGAQPLVDSSGQLALAVNGEIYNHQLLRNEIRQDYQWQTASDCEVILALYQRDGRRLLDQLNGMYAFTLYDKASGQYLIARDPIGIIPLYYGYDEHGQLFIASELKALVDVCTIVKEFPPGHYWDSELHAAGEAPKPFYKPQWRDYATVADNQTKVSSLRESLEQSVTRHLMTDVPYGVLLSGGLDSSIIAALTQKHAQNRVEDAEQSPAWWPRLHSFAVGLPGSPDLIAAKKAADHIGTVHHSFEYTLQEGLDALEEVIYHLETYDVTTIRAATPMFLMARKIRAMGIKMVLSGEGADEIFAGYLYFHKAPNAQALHEETVRKLDRLHTYDCLRANKSMAAWGIEARVPFLDRAFLETAMRVNPIDKMANPQRMEKYILREAFADLLPADIAWRQKEQFSDGVGYGWIDGLRAHAEQQVSDQQMMTARDRFGYHPPLDKEAYHYRSIFHQHFPLYTAAETVPGGPTVACSTPEAIAWDASLQNINDPSGRAALGVHNAAYTDT